MRRDVGAVVLGSLNRRAHLFRCELQRVERVVHRRRATANGQFDLRGTLAELFTHRCQDMRNTIGDAGETDRVGTAWASVELVRDLVDESEIAVTRSLGNHRLAGIDSRSLELTLVDEALHRSCVATHVPDCGETAQQHATSFGNRVAE